MGDFVRHKDRMGIPHLQQIQFSGALTKESAFKPHR
jgi:hypothetical protein